MVKANQSDRSASIRTYVYLPLFLFTFGQTPGWKHNYLNIIFKSWGHFNAKVGGMQADALIWLAR